VPVTDNRLVVGQVRGVHGLRGAVRVEILTDYEGRFDVGNVLHVEGSERALTVVSSHRDGPGLLVRFKEVTDRNGADGLREKYLEADAADLPADTWFWHDIIGCSVSTTEGHKLGEVADIFRVGGSEVYVVRGPRGEVLVPAVASIVRELVPAEKRIVVDGAALGLNEGDES
jgi:16S rRNA processing protein RimM